MNGFPYWSLVLVWIVLGAILLAAAAVQLRTIYLFGTNCFFDEELLINLIGKLPRFLIGYLTLITLVFMFLLLGLKHYKFHLHHFQIGLLLWPGTIFKTRFSMLFQSILLGIFLNGALIWGMEASLYDNVGMVRYI
jgi:hypothetical protein